jgi:hypothetical protein
MAVRAIHIQGGGEETHRAHEFVHGNSAKDLNIFEDVFRHLLLLAHRGLVGLAVSPGGPQEAQDRGSHGTTDRSSGMELHFASLAVRVQRRAVRRSKQIGACAVFSGYLFSRAK